MHAEDFLRRAHAGAEATWSRIVGGSGNPSPVIPRVLFEGTAQTMGEDGQEDGVEISPAGRRVRTTGVHLQKELSSLRDRTRSRELETTLELQGNWPQLDRVRELQHLEVSHRWLSHLDTRNGSVLAAADFVINVQKRV